MLLLLLFVVTVVVVVDVDVVDDENVVVDAADVVDGVDVFVFVCCINLELSWAISGLCWAILELC